MFFGSPVSCSLISSVHCIEIEMEIDHICGVHLQAIWTYLQRPKQSPDHCRMFSLKSMWCIPNSFRHATCEVGSILIIEIVCIIMYIYIYIYTNVYMYIHVIRIYMYMYIIPIIRIPIMMGWMTIPHMLCFDHGTHGKGLTRRVCPWENSSWGYQAHLLSDRTRVWWTTGIYRQEEGSQQLRK